MHPCPCCSINFGGGGIFGACKNIDISEINGYVTLRGEAGEMAADGTVIRPARLIMQFEGPGGGKQAQQQQQQGSAAARPQLSRKSSQLAGGSSYRTGGGSSPSEAGGGGSVPPSPLRPASSGGRPAGSPPQQQQQLAQQQQAQQQLPPPQQAQRPPLAPPSKQVAGPRVGALRGGAGAADTRSSPDSAASLESTGSDQLLERAAAVAAGGSRRQLGGQSQQQVQQAQQRQQRQLSQEQAQAQAQAQAASKGKNAALRFLSRLGSKKDKYQSKERGGLLQVCVGGGDLACCLARACARVCACRDPRQLPPAAERMLVLVQQIAGPAARCSCGCLCLACKSADVMHDDVLFAFPRLHVWLYMYCCSLLQVRTLRRRPARRPSARWPASCSTAAKAGRGPAVAAVCLAVLAAWIGLPLAATSCQGRGRMPGVLRMTCRHAALLPHA